MSIPSSKDRSILPDEMIEATRQPTNMTIPPELFEQLYLAPKTKVKGHLRETFGNPTPIALGGFILTTTPVSMALLGWQGAGGFLAGANAGVFFWLGGIMTLLGAIGEWILGNTFPATVFFTFSCFWLTLSATISPDFNAIGLYSTTTNPADGLAQPQFYSTFSFFLVAMAMVCVVFMVASLRTNIFFFLMFALLVACLSCLSASFFAVANGRSSALGFQHAGAAILLAVSFLGWYFFAALVLLSVDFPIVLPIGDLSTVIKGRSARVEQEEAQKNGENGSSG